MRSEYARNIDRTPEGKNKLRLVITENQGWFYINGDYQGIIPLRAVDIDISKIDLAVYPDEIEGKSTRFEDFTIWKWHPSLQKLPKTDDD